MAKPDVPIVPTLEQMGALSSLLVHDLANHLCIITGNASYAELIPHDAERVAAAIRAIVQASEMAGGVLGKAGEMRRLISRAVVPSDVAETIERLTRWYGGNPRWSLEVETGLAGRIAVDAKWVVLAVERAVGELGAEAGAIRLGPGRLEGPAGPRDCLLVRVTGESTKAFSIERARDEFENLGLLAAFEILRNNGGRLEAGASTPTRQEVRIWVARVGPPADHGSVSGGCAAAEGSGSS